MNKYFATDESLIAYELWDFLSGQQKTMEQILEIINTIATTSFQDKFRLLTDNTKRTHPNYISQLTEWNLFSEIELIKNNSTIIQKIGRNTTLTRIYNKTAFNHKGNYCRDRYIELRQLL